tara:strand:- start:796 stop:1035 length:240 start_codon:yes stop_codon:yes gene_type:complete
MFALLARNIEIKTSLAKPIVSKKGYNYIIILEITSIHPLGLESELPAMIIKDVLNFSDIKEQIGTYFKRPKLFEPIKNL